MNYSGPLQAALYAINMYEEEDTENRSERLLTPNKPVDNSGWLNPNSAFFAL